MCSDIFILTDGTPYSGPAEMHSAALPALTMTGEWGVDMVVVVVMAGVLGRRRGKGRPTL